MRLNLKLLLLPLCLISSCTTDLKRGDTIVTHLIVRPYSQPDIDQLLEYAMHARKLDGREISNEREQVRKNFQAEQSEFNRVKLAILLASTTAPSPATGTSDDNELGALLAPIVRVVNPQTAVVPANAGTSEIRTLATLIYALALDRKKVRDYSRDVQLRAHALRRDDSKEVETRALRARG